MLGYLVDGEHCDCSIHQRAPHGWCWHRAAVACVRYALDLGTCLDENIERYACDPDEDER
jgi:hypothetical protein